MLSLSYRRPDLLRHPPAIERLLGAVDRAQFLEQLAK